MKQATRNNNLRAGSLLALIAALFVSAVSQAQPMTIDVLPRGYVGVPLPVKVRLDYTQSYQRPIAPTDIKGATLTEQAGTSQGFEMMFGQSSRWIEYRWLLTPEKEGLLIVPSFVATVDSKEVKTKMTSIQIVSPGISDIAVMEVTADPETAYVGQPIKLTLNLLIAPFEYQTRRGLQQLSSTATFNQIQNSSQWGIFTASIERLLSAGRVPSDWGRLIKRTNDKGEFETFYRYPFETTFIPDKQGQLDIGELRLVINYPRGVTQDFWGAIVPSSTTPEIITADVPSIDIKSPPREGRVPGYTGAVGQYAFRMSAQPLDVAVGDPITLTMKITDLSASQSDLDRLQPPDLASIQSLTKNFKVPDELPAGTIQGQSKIFTQTIRATSKNVTEIPAIPFTYFDPAEEQYESSRSTPIAISVKPATSLTLQDIVGNNANDMTPLQSLSEQSEGIGHNYTGPDLLTVQSTPIAWIFYLALLCPPLLFAVAASTQAHRSRLAKDPSLARRRTALRRAMAALNEAKRLDDQHRPEAIAIALRIYIADRLGIPEGGLTGNEAAAQLLAAGATPQSVTMVTNVFAATEQSRYAGQTSTHSSDLITDAKSAINAIEQESLK
ncbi:MAG: BatD family protein [Phycisphaerales bacterium]|nr:BatD family protein [Phycisphaerales bacterium]